MNIDSVLKANVLEKVDISETKCLWANGVVNLVGGSGGLVSRYLTTQVKVAAKI